MTAQPPIHVPGSSIAGRSGAKVVASEPWGFAPEPGDWSSFPLFQTPQLAQNESARGQVLVHVATYQGNPGLSNFCINHRSEIPCQPFHRRRAPSRLPAVEAGTRPCTTPRAAGRRPSACCCRRGPRPSFGHQALVHLLGRSTNLVSYNHGYKWG